MPSATRMTRSWKWMPSIITTGRSSSVKRTTQPLVELVLAQRHEAPRHRALGRRRAPPRAAAARPACRRSGAWTRPRPSRPSWPRSAGRLWRPRRSWAARARPCSSPRTRGPLDARCAGRRARPAAGVLPPRRPRAMASGTFLAPHSATRSASIIAASTCWPLAMHRPWKACRTSRSTPCTGNENLHLAAGTTRSAGFVRDFISVVPFFACSTCMFTCRRKEPPPQHHAFNRIWDIAISSAWRDNRIRWSDRFFVSRKRDPGALRDRHPPRAAAGSPVSCGRGSPPRGNR